MARALRTRYRIREARTSTGTGMDWRGRYHDFRSFRVRYPYCVLSTPRSTTAPTRRCPVAACALGSAADSTAIALAIAASRGHYGGRSKRLRLVGLRDNAIAALAVDSHDDNHLQLDAAPSRSTTAQLQKRCLSLTWRWLNSWRSVSTACHACGANLVEAVVRSPTAQPPTGNVVALVLRP